jgi:hypothetical protein
MNNITVTAVNVKVVVCRDVTLCRLVETIVFVFRD